MEKFYNVQLQDYIISNGTPVWVVCDVHPQRNYTLLLTFASGEKRISNFMLFQMAYSELYFTKVCWPDFDKKQLDKALKDYSKRNRRFGGK